MIKLIFIFIVLEVKVEPTIPTWSTQQMIGYILKLSPFVHTLVPFEPSKAKRFSTDVKNVFTSIIFSIFQLVNRNFEGVFGSFFSTCS